MSLELDWISRRYRLPCTPAHFVIFEARASGFAATVRAWSTTEISWIVETDERYRLPVAAGMAAHIGDAVVAADQALLEQLTLHQKFALKAARRRA